MQKLRLAFAFFALSFLTITCTTEDHVLPAPCKYLGKSYKIQYSYGSAEEHHSNVTLDENGLLKEAVTVYISSFTDVSTNTENSKGTDQRKYNFTYDADGFLKQM